MDNLPEPIVQGSAAWFAIRLGKITGSRIADMMATTKNGPAASRANYAADLVCERLTGISTPQGFVSNDMTRGTELEPAARAAYCEKRGTLIEQIGFRDHQTIPLFGVSPDGLVDDDGMVEIKCPNAANHIATIIDGKAPTRYLPQMQAGMMTCERQWCDFISYHPDLPPHLRLAIFRVNMDPEYQKKVAAEIVAFNREIEAIIAKLLAIKP